MKSLLKIVVYCLQAHLELFYGPGAIENNEAPDDIIMKLQAEKREIYGP